MHPESRYPLVHSQWVSFWEMNSANFSLVNFLDSETNPSCSPEGRPVYLEDKSPSCKPPWFPKVGGQVTHAGDGCNP